MTPFDSFDRYDVALSVFLGVCLDACLILGASLWVIVPIPLVCCVIIFIRHFDEIMFPEDRDPPIEAKRHGMSH